MPGKAWTTAVIALALLPVPTARAQQWLVNNAINNQIVETAICDGALKKHEKLPNICARYSRYSGAAGQRRATPQPSARAMPRAAGSAKFMPDTSDDSLRKLMESVGANPQEKQQLLQVAQAGKAVFEKKYGPKGWKNDLAGAYAFFIVAVSTVYDDREPDVAIQDRLFASFSATLAETPDLARASARDKTALYNMLIAGGGVPLLFYVDGKQRNDAAEVDQAKKVAAAFSRKLMNVESQVLAAMAR